jgi:orotidine-5'-phosphate decarboxylase
MHDKTIVALDMPSLKDNLNLIDQLDNHMWYKTGLNFVTQNGFDAVRNLALYKNVFLDLKLYDIGNTVQDAVRNVADMGVKFLTVMGDPHIVEAASKVKGDVKILAVTVLTSLNRNDLNMNLIKDGDLDYIVEQRTDLAFRFGADGVICSPEEIKLVRKNYKDKLIVTPGIRNKQDDAGDQKRIATRSQAFNNGADYVVVGRPVYKAHNPLEALRNL